MFGTIVAGRPVQTEFQQVDPTKFLLDLPQANLINHIVVFLTTPLPPGYGATIHFDWPGKPWTLLGMVSNDKPSAVFKVGGKKGGAIDVGGDMMEDSTVTAQLGVCIDLLDNVLQSVSALHSAPSDMSISTALVPVTSSVTIVNRVLESLYNYCTSFATNSVPVGGNILFGRDLGSSFIPLKTIQDWYTQTQRKLSMNPSLFDPKE